MCLKIFIIFFAILISGHTHRLTPRLNPKNHWFSPVGRIVGGEPTSIESHPWQVSIQTLGFHFCGGSIISENYILTAGHCTISYPFRWLSVRVGSSKLMDGGVVHRVNETILHEDFKGNDFNVLENDIAILRLRTSITLNKAAQPIPLFTQGEVIADGTLSTITGWGSTAEGGKLPDTLQSVNVPIVNKAECSKAYEQWGGIPKGQICAAYPAGGKDTCQGDSGGPLVIGGRQAGIVSWGNGCARKGYPGVYTEVASFYNWIIQNTKI